MTLSTNAERVLVALRDAAVGERPVREHGARVQHLRHYLPNLPSWCITNCLVNLRHDGLVESLVGGGGGVLRWRLTAAGEAHTRSAQTSASAPAATGPTDRTQVLPTRATLVAVYGVPGAGPGDIYLHVRIDRKTVAVPRVGDYVTLRGEYELVPKARP